MKKRCEGIFLSLLIFTLIFSSFTLPSKAESTNKKTVKIGYYKNEVFEDGASDEEIKKGYAYEYYRKISEYTGWEYEYIYGDFVSIYQMLLDGEVDLVAGLAYTDDRASLILYPERPMGSERYSIVKHEGDRSISNNTSSLSGKSIGVLDSAIVSVLNEFLAKEKVTANVLTYSDYKDLLSAFDRNEIDVMAAEIEGIYDRNNARVLYNFGESDYYIGVNKNAPSLLKDLNEAQALLAEENPDYLSMLRTKYYSSTLSSRAFTKSETEWISSHRILKIGYLDDFLPLSDTDKDGNVTGIVSEVVPYIFEEMGLNGIDYEFISYKKYDDIVKDIAKEEIDVGFPMGGGLFYSEVDGLYLTNSLISSVTDLVFSDIYKGSSDANFAVNENNNLQYYFVKNNFPDSKITVYSSIDECLKAVANGEVTCTTLNGLRTGAILNKYHNHKLSFMQLNESEENCFGVKIGNDGLLKLLNRGISISGQDYAQNLALKYSQTMYTFTFWDFISNYLWQILLTIIILFILTNLLIYRNARKRDLLSKQLIDSKIEIEKANRDKFIFVDNITNNMREPMSKLTSLIDSSKRTDDLAKRDSNLNDMSDQTRLLITMINNISSLVNNTEEKK
ncbi:MAG: transporter substrate-binding domain-containing protein [Butyrivibrio sp.]|nr:transporter substrate-binding domain-containing protein [Butyrivibrio sp.]